MDKHIQGIDAWLVEAKAMAMAIAEKAAKNNAKSVFTIGATAKVCEDNLPYLTPVRDTPNNHIGGVIVFTQTQAILVAREVDGIVDYVMVDAEKKLKITMGIDKELLNYFNIPIDVKSNARVHVEMGNVSAACSPYIRKSIFHEYKSNDLTVESVWHSLSYHLELLSGKKVAILGCGNIGFKLALKLVESGCHVEIVRRDMSKGMMMANVLNIVKPSSTMATVNFNPDPLQASLFCDALVGCTNGVPIIDWQMIQSMKPQGIVIDVGKGSIHSDAVNKAAENNISLMRCDVTSSLIGLVSTAQQYSQSISSRFGRSEISEGIFIVSGGYLGMLGDIVVDNFKDPKRVIGVCDGVGDLKKDLSADETNRLMKLNDLIRQ